MDHEDFDEFVVGRWVALFRLAYLLTADEEAAGRLLQNAMERTFARWSTVVRMEFPETYVRRVMVNAVIADDRRVTRRRVWPRAVVPERAAPSDDGPSVDRLMVWPLVCALPVGQRAVLVLRYYEDLSEGGAAEVLGCSVRAVRSQTQDAIRALQRGVAAMETEAVDG